MPYQNTKPVKSVEKALRLLELLAEAKRPLSLGELSARSGWPKSTVYGLLAALREGGAAEQRAEDGRYCLGIRLFEFGPAAVPGISEPRPGPLLRARRSSAASRFFSPRSTAGMCSYGQGGAAGSCACVGDRRALPIHCTCREALMAMPRPGAPASAAGGLTTSTHPTRSATPTELEAEREDILSRGYAIENGEYRVGLRSVSAPVRDARGEVRWAVTVSGMYRKLGSDEFSGAVLLIVEAAAEISRTLGWRE
jgi:IclR family acetate operon transcriptional repressor